MRKQVNKHETTHSQSPVRTVKYNNTTIVKALYIQFCQYAIERLTHDSHIIVETTANRMQSIYHLSSVVTIGAYVHIHDINKHAMVVLLFQLGPW